MHRRVIPLVALLLAAGCTLPEESTPEADDPAVPTPFEGPPEPIAEPTPEAPAIVNETPPVQESTTDAPPITTTPPPPEPAAPTPATTPTTNDTAWPRNGSYVRYRTTGGSDTQDPDHKLVEEAILTLTYHGGAWQGMCRWTRGEVTTSERAFGESMHMTNATGSAQVDFGPLVVSAKARSVGDIRGIHDCELDRLGSGGFAFDGWSDDWWGERDMPAWTDDGWFDWGAPRETTTTDAGDSFAHWDPKTGLLVAWRDARAHTFTDGWLDATDAPLGETITSLPSPS